MFNIIVDRLKKWNFLGLFALNFFTLNFMELSRTFCFQKVKKIKKEENNRNVSVY